jgi:hypothetical protein
MSIHRSHCSDQTTGWTIRCSNPDKDTRIFNSPKRQDWLWAPLSLQYSAYCNYFGRQSDRGINLTRNLNPVFMVLLTNTLNSLDDICHHFLPLAYIYNFCSSIPGILC